MSCYVDSSVVLRYLLVHDSAFTRTSKFDIAGSSEFLIIECNRALDRYHLLSADPQMLTCATALGVSLLE